MLEKLMVTDNVIRVDLTRRTVDLGNWNITVNTKNYATKIAEIDTIINDTALLTRSIITEKKIFDALPTPTQLEKPPKRKQSQVSEEYRNWIMKGYPYNIPLIVMKPTRHTIRY